MASTRIHDDVSMDVARQQDMEAYCEALQTAGLDAPWSRPGPLIQAKASRVEPCLWRGTDIEPLLGRSAELVAPDKGAERRILRLMNPGVPERTSTHTISVAVQFLLPGETAPSHRHTPNALRFMLRGHGAYTNVEGQKCDMVPGDLVLTPSLWWHEHGNEGGEPVMWIDGLDSPVVRFLEVLGMQPRADRDATVGGPAHESRSFIAALEARELSSGTRRTIHYRWDAAYAALLARSSADPDPHDDVILEYRDPATGASVLPTLGCYLQMIRPGVETASHIQTSSAVYYAVRGSGVTTIGERQFAWGEGDYFAVPPLARHAHANSGTEPAILFSVQDVPLLKALGHYHEA